MTARFMKGKRGMINRGIIKETQNGAENTTGKTTTPMIKEEESEFL